MKNDNVTVNPSNFVIQKHHVGALLILIFLLSVLIRLPNLNRPLSLHHEWVTAQSLIYQQIWHEEGGLKYAFCPVTTYGNKADKNISNVSNQRDARGNFYYVSLPPFAHILPYLIFRLLHIYPNVLPLQIFNLILHFISGVFIYLIISLLTKRYYMEHLNIPALLGFSSYLFAPATMWFQSNTYFSNQVAQPLFIIGIYVFLKFTGSENKKPIYLFLIGLINFFIIYSDWTGVLFAASVVLYTLTLMKRKEMRRVLYIIAITSLASVALILWQYSQISGFDDYINALAKRYKARSGLTQSGLHYFKLRSWENVISHYINNYLLLLVIIYTFAWIYFIQFNGSLKKETFNKAKDEIVALYLCTAPVLLSHSLLFNLISVHDTYILQTSVFISLSIALLYYRLVRNLKLNPSDENKKAKVVVLNSFMVLMLISSMLQYMLVNRKGDESFKSVGEEIAKRQRNDEVVFIKTENYNKEGWRGAKGTPPQLVFYAHRNIAVWKSDSTAKELLALNDVERGVIFVLDQENSQIVDIEYVNR